MSADSERIRQTLDEFGHVMMMDHEMSATESAKAEAARREINLLWEKRRLEMDREIAEWLGDLEDRYGT